MLVPSPHPKARAGIAALLTAWSLGEFQAFRDELSEHWFGLMNPPKSLNPINPKPESLNPINPKPNSLNPINPKPESLVQILTKLEPMRFLACPVSSGKLQANLSDYLGIMDNSLKKVPTG